MHPQHGPTVEQLQSQIAKLKDEIDSLQILSKNFVKPWHKDIAGLMSIIAVIFSLGTTAVSYHNALQQERQARRIELRELIGKLGKLPRDAMEYAQKYGNNPTTASSFSSLINNENQILAKQASEVMTAIPDLVSASEHIYIGSALSQSAMHDRARDHFEAAAKMSRDLNDVVASLRSLGMIAYMQGDLKKGREYYSRAKSELRSANITGTTPDLIEYSDAITEMRWAQMEAFRNACADFNQHVTQALVHIGRMPQASRYQVLQELAQIRATGCPVQGMPSQMTTASTGQQRATSTAAPAPAPAPASAAPQWRR